MSTMDAHKAELTRFLVGFGANVRRVRLAKRPHLSQERLALLTRLHRTEIGRIEQGLVEPRLTTLVVLADGLAVTLDELTDGLWVPVERKPAANGDAWTEGARS